LKRLGGADKRSVLMLVPGRREGLLWLFVLVI
jgi:hypothetical protein